MRIVYSSCPCCNSASIALALTAKDETVSGEQYEIWECANCRLRFTQTIPPQDEIGKYYKSENYISHTENNKGLINSLYHAVRRRTLRSKKSMIEKEGNITRGTLLDIGAGTGAFLNTMKAGGWDVTGLEPDDLARKNARDLYNLELRKPDDLYALPPDSVDAITMWHVLEHVHNLNGYMKRLSEIIKLSGNIFIAVPNYTSYDADFYKAHWAAYDVPRHLYHFSPQAMKKLINLHGLELKSIKPMWYDSFYVSMLSQRYKNGKGNSIAAVWNGAVSNLKALFNRERCSSIIYVISKK